MRYTIENEFIRLGVDSVGAEMGSLIRKSDGTEYLWQRDAEYWASSASNLFPICGRLTQGKYTYRGETYEMILHGFARKMEMTCQAHTENRLSFVLRADAETLRQYPFRFVLCIDYTLEGASVRQTFTVKNEDEKIMPFAVGGHPGFNVPLEAGETFSDYYLQFDCGKEPRALVMSPTCYFTGETVPFPLEEGGTLSLRHEMFDNDAIFLTEMCKGVTLRSRKSGHAVHLRYPDMQYLGLWHKPRTQAPYLCIEPWYSTPAYDGRIDDLETKHAMLPLEPGGVSQNSITITIC